MEEEKNQQEEAVLQEGASPKTGADAAPKKGGSNSVGIVIGIVVFVAVLAFCWKTIDIGGVSPVLGITYAKNNDLYVYDLENEPYLAQKGISNGGQYNFFYTAWGSSFSEDGNNLYYIANLTRDNEYDLYKRETTNREKGILVGERVADYHISEDGEKAAFLRLPEDVEKGAELFFFDGTKEILVDKGILPETDTYEISTDGAYVAYIKQEKTGNHLYVCGTQEGDKPFLLAENAALFTLAKETNTLYYVAADKDVYTAYRYLYGAEPEVVLTGATYMEVMDNGKDVLLMSQNPDKKIPYTQLIEDDMAQKDAQLKATEGEEYEAKKARDEMRKIMQNGEGIAPILQECYIYAGGNLILVSDSVLSAVSVANDRPFAIYYGVDTEEKIKLSEISSLQDVEMKYYMNLAYGDKKLHLVDAGGNDWELQDTGIDPSTIQLSKNGSSLSYCIGDGKSKETVLKAGKLGKSFEEVARNVEKAEFLGNSDTLAYFKDFKDGVGTIGIMGQEEIKEASGIHFAKDKEAVYYITDANPETGNGTLYVIEEGQKKKLDENVFSIQYKNNGHLAYFKNYDYAAGVGDLYYYDGKDSKELDTGVTSVFM